jgi:hypothetical protein
MAGEADQVPSIIVKPTADDNKSDSRTESDSLMASSSPKVVAEKMVDGTVPSISDY